MNCNLPHPPLDGRIKRYQELAIEAQEAAANLPPSRHRDGYLRIAKHWTDLVLELEDSLARTPPTYS